VSSQLPVAVRYQAVSWATVAMDIEWVPLLKQSIWGPAALFTALYFPDVSYASSSSRVASFIGVVLCSVYAFRPHDVATSSTSYLIGFAPVWTVVLGYVLLLLCHPPRDFRRIRRKSNQNSDATNPKLKLEYCWEPFPSQIGFRRFAWIFDLLLNFRGIGWSYQKRQRQVPDEVKILYKEIEIDLLKDGIRNKISEAPQDRSSFLLTQSAFFAVDYLLLDLCIHFMNADPCFNLLDTPPAIFDPAKTISSQALAVLLRVLCGTVGVFVVMDLFHVLVALTCVGLFGERILGTWGEPWAHPGLWGSPIQIYERGLPGTRTSLQLSSILYYVNTSIRILEFFLA